MEAALCQAGNRDIQSAEPERWQKLAAVLPDSLGSCYSFTAAHAYSKIRARAILLHNKFSKAVVAMSKQRHSGASPIMGIVVTAG
jgi:hypothetical protein